MLLRQFRRWLFVLTALMAWTLPSGSAWAHGGVAVEFDTCRIPVSGYWVHFTAYTPMTTADTEYCGSIPEPGMTNVVIDYEDKALRRMTVEYEITKEPEGNVIFHQDAQTLPTGTLNIPIDFTPYGSGDYLAHITLINGEEKVDAHAPFTIGTGGTGVNPAVYLLALLGILGALYFFVPAVRQKVDGMFGGGGDAAA